MFCVRAGPGLVVSVLAACLGSLGVLVAGGAAAEPVTLRLSTENTPTHVQTRSVQRFADRLAARTGGRLTVEYHHSAELFRDKDVIRALADGKVDMAVPGMWQLDRYEPNVGLYMLPMFYGRDEALHHRIRDGAVGRAVAARLERVLDVKVVGRWLDLGYAHLYFTDRAVDRHEDLAGLRIRVAGGRANLERLRAFAADPVVIPWPDLPTALTRRQVDGVLTTHETVKSAALWTRGIRHAFEDREYFPQYVPLIAGHYWARLSPDRRDAIVESWEAIVDQARRDAAAAQIEARAVLETNGVRIARPSTAALTRWRAIAMVGQDRLVADLDIDPALVALAKTTLDRP